MIDCVLINQNVSKNMVLISDSELNDTVSKKSNSYKSI